MKVSASASRIGIVTACILALAACGKSDPKPKVVSELKRKEAEHHVAEANFAINLRDWPRAEGLLAKAAECDPTNGLYALSLGTARLRLNNKAGAKQAYESALKAFQAEAATEEGRKDPEASFKQVHALALLGRTDEARALVEKLPKKFPDNRSVRTYVEQKHFDKMIADPAFKQGAL